MKVVKIYLKKVSSEVFKEMQILGLIKDDKFNKNFSTTCRNKKGKRKKHYVEEPLLNEYLRIVG